MRVHDVQYDFKKWSKVTALDVIQTNKLSPMLYYPEKNLLFQGGINGVCAIDCLLKRVVARFKVKGVVHSLRVSHDRGSLIVLTKEGEAEECVNSFYKFSLKKVEYEVLDVLGRVSCFCESSLDDEIMFIALDGTSLKTFNIRTKEVGLPIAELREPKSTICVDYKDEYCFVRDSSHVVYRINT